MDAPVPPLETDTRSRSRWSLLLLPLVALMLAGIVLWWARGDNGAISSRGPDRDPASEETSPALLAATSGETEPEGPGPTLHGRSIETVPGETARYGVRVTVLGPAGMRLPWFRVWAYWEVPGETSPRRVEARTGSDGTLFFPDVPLDGSAHVTARHPCDPRPPGRSPDPVVTGPEFELRVRRGLALRVQLVDAEAGYLLDEAVVRIDVAESSSFEGSPDRNGRHVAPVGQGTRDSVRLEVDAPSGYVAWDPTRWSVPVGLWTRELEAVYPLRREATVRVTVFDHEGHREEGATLEGIRVAGRSGSVKDAEDLGPGTFRLRGVPLLRGEVLQVGVRAPGLAHAVWRGVCLPGHPADLTDLTIVLPPPGPKPEGSTAIGIGGGSCSTRFYVHGHPKKTGTLRIEMKRNDGSPAAGAKVSIGGRCHDLDDQGVLRLEHFAVGDWKVEARTIGLLPTQGTVRVEEGAVARLDLQEPRGGAVELWVTDVAGDPLPFATIRISTPSKQPWVDEKDGRQRVDPFTDHLGYRRLERVESGRIGIRASWGDRRGKTEVEVSEGDVARATIVLH